VLGADVPGLGDLERAQPEETKKTSAAANRTRYRGADMAEFRMIRSGNLPRGRVGCETARNAPVGAFPASGRVCERDASALAFVTTHWTMWTL
jgi:hypothetical protein